jgi:hypothetical protein
VFQDDPVSRTRGSAVASSAGSVAWNGGHIEQMNAWLNAGMADAFA